MRTPDDAAVIAATRYRRSWRDALLDGDPGTFSIPLHPPTATKVESDPAAVAEWLHSWRLHRAAHPHHLVRAHTIRTKHGGQPVPTHLDLPDTTALADLNADTRDHWQHVTARWAQVRAVVTDRNPVRPWLTQLMELPDVDFVLLLAAAEWFRRNPKSGLTIRRVPVRGMHTKWLARHRRLVLALLGFRELPGNDASLPDEKDADPNNVPAADLDALGLRPLPREADVVLADPDDRARIGGLRHLRAPIDELARLPITPEWVLVVENKEAALALPDIPDLVIVHSLGNQLDLLQALPWIPPRRAVYWGDMDRHGYTLLSRARTALTGTLSMLMSSADTDRFRELAVAETLARYDPPDPTLTNDEKQALAALTNVDHHLRIEQERIDVAEAVQALSRVTGKSPKEAATVDTA